MNKKKINTCVIVNRVSESLEDLSICNNEVNCNFLSSDLNPPDKCAVEAAIQFKENFGTSLTVIAIGHNDFKTVLTRLISIGCDDAFLIDSGRKLVHDSRETASLLKVAINSLNNPQIIFCGEASTETCNATSFVILSKLLKFNYLSQVSRIIDTSDEINSMIIKRVIGNTCETLDIRTPVILQIDKSFAKLRHPTFASLKRAGKTPIQTINPINQTNQSYERGTTIFNITEAEIPKKECKFLQGNTSKELAKEIILNLKFSDLL